VVVLQCGIVFGCDERWVIFFVEKRFLHILDSVSSDGMVLEEEKEKGK